LLGHLFWPDMERNTKKGISIPEPVSIKKWSGTFTTRIDSQTHRLLAVKAKQKGKLLSKFIQEILQQAVA